MASKLDNDILDKAIRWLAKQAESGEFHHGPAGLIDAVGVSDLNVITAIAQYCRERGAIETLMTSDEIGPNGGQLVRFTISANALDSLAEWKRERLDLERRVDHWLRRRWAGVALIVGVRYIAPLAAVVIAMFALLNDPASDPPSASAPQQAAPPTDVIAARRFEVTRVVDGDTFKIVYDGEETSVRILGIDTPERGEPGFEEATAALRDLVAGRIVRLAFPEDRKRDSFGRLLARVHVNGLDVGDLLLRRGLAERYRD